MLRMDDLATKVSFACKIGLVALVIIIIASAHEQETRGKVTFLATINGLRRHMPAGIWA